MEPSGEPTKGPIGADQPQREIGKAGRGHLQFSRKIGSPLKIIKKQSFGQSSLPIWVLGTIEFIWAGGIPLKPQHKIIPPQNHLFMGPFFGTKRSPGPNVDPTSQNLTRGRCWVFFQITPKVRTANPSEILSRTHPSKLQTSHEVKSMFPHFPAKIAN